MDLNLTTTREQHNTKVHGHAIADIGWYNREPAKTFFTTCLGSQENRRRN